MRMLSLRLDEKTEKELNYILMHKGIVVSFMLS